MYKEIVCRPTLSDFVNLIEQYLDSLHILKCWSRKKAKNHNLKDGSSISKGEKTDQLPVDNEATVSVSIEAQIDVAKINKQLCEFEEKIS